MVIAGLALPVTRRLGLFKSESGVMLFSAMSSVNRCRPAPVVYSTAGIATAARAVSMNSMPRLVSGRAIIACGPAGVSSM